MYTNGQPVAPDEPPVPAELMVPNGAEEAGEARPISSIRTTHHLEQQRTESLGSGSHHTESPGYFGDDPNAIFTFAPGSDFVAPCVSFDSLL
jgi:hypothetical protein